MEASQKKINAVNLKSQIVGEISSIDDVSLLGEISKFLETKKQLYAIKSKYGDGLYDSLNTEELRKESLHEKNIYKSLTKLLKKLSKERNKNTWISKEDRNLFNPNEPAIKDILSKSLFAADMWLEKWINKFRSPLWDERIPFVGEHAIVFEKGKLRYRYSTIYTTDTGSGPGTL